MSFTEMKWSVSWAVYEVHVVIPVMGSLFCLIKGVAMPMKLLYDCEIKWFSHAKLQLTRQNMHLEYNTWKWTPSNTNRRFILCFEIQYGKIGPVDVVFFVCLFACWGEWGGGRNDGEGEVSLNTYHTELTTIWGRNYL